MKKITSATIYKAFDGKIFTSSSECERYEKQRKEFLSNLKFFVVRCNPDLNETGLFTKALLVAVYSKDVMHKEIVNNYCIKKFGYLGKGVQGLGFRTYFSISPINFETYSEGILGYELHPKKILLSPIELDEFKGIERFDYMKEWGFK